MSSNHILSDEEVCIYFFHKALQESGYFKLQTAKLTLNSFKYATTIEKS